MDFNPVVFDKYAFQVALIQWLKIVGGLSLVGLAISLMLSVARNGASGLPAFFRGLAGFLEDLGSLSPRRIYAVTLLTVKEAVRRKALLVFVVFAVLLMFAGWFISNANERADLQVNVHITFVLTTIAWLMLPPVIFLSCWGIPEDIRLRSLHTVVTKPARRIEVVLGRILGFGSVAAVVLAVMGVIGYVWVQRQIPENVRDRLTCRVPVFGNLYFIDNTGQPSREGINTGDVWKYRSYIQGNSRARAVWVFQDIRPETVGDDLVLESRFEAFRTIKGSEKSILEGLEAQYTLVRNPREEAFGGLALSGAVKEIADALRDGQFRNGSDKFTELAQKIRTSHEDIPLADYAGLAAGANQAYMVLEAFDKDLKPLADLFGELSEATTQLRGQSSAAGDTVYTNIADRCDDVAGYLSENVEDLQEKLPRLEVPLPSFSVSEFHEGDNVSRIPRKITAVPDYETLARFLAAKIEELNESGKLVDGNGLSASLVDVFTENDAVSILNAELLESVLSGQLDEGTLKIDGGKLAVADGRRWFGFFDDLVRREMLGSRDPEGWKMEFDLFEDLTTSNNLRIEVSCLNDQMYLGMARPDLFVRLPDRPFFVGYSKAILTTGIMLMLLVVIGVTASCVVKGPVAVFFTFTVFLVGQFFHQFMLRIVEGNEQGLGLVESAALIVQHRNPSVGMNASQATQNFVRGVDSVSTGLLSGASSIIPDFSVFGTAAQHVEKGFDVPLNVSVWPSLAIFFAFLIPCVLLAGAFLKFRELESK
ncbi:MAG: hypothetical protein R3C20_18750 [Planctomycetaceae bacterium]